jgi:hypothetical protein
MMREGTVMTTKTTRRLRLGAALGVALALAGCGLTKQSVPDSLVGPATLALDLKLSASPDYVVADNESISVVTATLRGPSGQPVSGRAIIFEITDTSGNPVGLGELSQANGQLIASGASATATTDGNGIARVRFYAPARSDLLAPTDIAVRARPVGEDYNGAVWHTVRIQVIPADGRLFPPSQACGIVVQPGIGPNPDGSYPPGFQILFQSTGIGVRFEWAFGDGATDDKPNVNHAYGKTGTFTVTHVVTAASGTQTPCSVVIVVNTRD